MFIKAVGLITCFIGGFFVGAYTHHLQCFGVGLFVIGFTLLGTKSIEDENEQI